MLVQSRAFQYHQNDDPQHVVVTDPDEFWRAIRWMEQHQQIAVDTETSGVDWARHARICGASVAACGPDGKPQCFYFPIRHQTGERQLNPEMVMDGMRALLENPHVTKVLHNIKFDERMFLLDGVRILGPRRDTMIEAHFYDENSPLGLKERAATDLKDPRAHVFDALLDRTLTRLAKEVGMKKEDYRSQFGYARIPIMLCGKYAAWDVDFTLRLADFYDAAGIRRFFARTYDTEMGLTEVLRDMEGAGLPVDVAYLADLSGTLGRELARLEPMIWSGFGGWRFNPASDAELVDALQNRLGASLTKRTKGYKLAVDAEVLDGLAVHHPVCRLVLAFREVQKLKSTYADGILSRLGWDGLLHADFQQVGTNTGRLSCRNPNMQNFSGDSDDRAKAHSGKKLKEGGIDPWSIKRAFVNRGPEWVRVYWDYSQIELRVMAFYSQDPVMVEAYLKGEDIHSRTAMEVFGAADEEFRRLAKVINFGLSYCMSAQGYSRNTGVPEEQAAQHLARFFARYHGIETFRTAFWQQCRRDGNAFLNLFGRPRRIPDLSAQEGWRRGRAERQAIGSLIQGSAAELTKESLVRIHRWEQRHRSGLLLVNTIHDEVSPDVPAKSARDVIRAITPLMEGYPMFHPIPILTDVKYSTTNWAEKRSLPKEWAA